MDVPMLRTARNITSNLISDSRISLKDMTERISLVRGYLSTVPPIVREA